MDQSFQIVFFIWLWLTLLKWSIMPYDVARFDRPVWAKTDFQLKVSNAIGSSDKQVFQGLRYQSFDEL